MKNISYYLGLALSVILAGCSAEDEDFASLTPQQGEPIQITVGMPSQDDSRVSFEGDDVVYKQLVWDKGDQLLLVGFADDGTYKGKSELTVQDASDKKKTGVFNGLTVAGATKYDVYYKTSKLSVVGGEATEAPSFNMTYADQAQSAPNSAAHLKDYLYLKTAAQVTSAELATGIKLTMQNAIFIFDIKSLDAGLGNNPSKLDWQFGNRSIQSIALTGDDYTGKNIYMCFDPTHPGTKLKPNEKMRILFTNRTTNDQYAVWATSTSGKIYSSNGRYKVSVGTTASENLKTWYKYTGSTEILIKTSDNQAPNSKYFGENLDLQPEKSGEYFVVKSKNDEPITEIPKDFLWNHPNVIDVKMPETVTSIGKSAFKHCSTLALTKLPDGLTSIGEFAFQNCSKLALKKLPDGLTSIGESVFESCSKLTLESLPLGVTTIGNNAFKGARLGAATGTVFTIPASVTSIGNSAFQNVSNVTNIIFDSPTTARTWAEGAVGTDIFLETNVTKITCPNDFKVIPQRMFQNMQSLKEVDFNGAKIESIGADAFGSCPNLVLGSLPSGVTSIGANAFVGCSKLALESLPLGVTSIGESAFSESKLGTDAGVFTIPCSVSSVGNMAFERLVDTKEVIWESPEKPRTWINLGNGILKLCHQLEKVVLPNDLTVITENMFGGCDVLKTVDFNNAPILELQNSAFQECNNLELKTLPKKLTKIGKSVFDKTCQSGDPVTLTIPATVTSIGQEAFANVKTISEVIFESNVKRSWTLGPDIFYQSTITKVTFPDDIIVIPEGMFKCCSNLTTVNWEALKNVTTIGECAFYDCSKLATIDLSSCEKLTSIKSSAFESCPITSLVIPANVTNIENNIIRFTSLTSLTVKAPYDKLTFVSGNPEFDHISFAKKVAVDSNKDVDLILDSSWKNATEEGKKPTFDVAPYTWAGCQWKSIKFIVGGGSITDIPETEPGLNDSHP